MFVRVKVLLNANATSEGERWMYGIVNTIYLVSALPTNSYPNGPWTIVTMHAGGTEDVVEYVVHGEPDQFIGKTVV